MRSLIRGWMAVGHFVAGLSMPMLGVGALRLLTKPRRGGEDRDAESLFAQFGHALRLVTPWLMALGGWFVLGLTLLITAAVIALAASGKLNLQPPGSAAEGQSSEPAAADKPADPPVETKPPPAAKPPAPDPLANVVSLLIQAAMVVIACTWVSWQGGDTREDMRGYGVAVRFRLALWRLVGTVFVLALSLLPLSALLLAYPALNPQESVLTDAVSARSSWFGRLLRRVGAAVTGLAVLFGLLAVSVEAVSRLPLPEKGSFSAIAKVFMPAPADVLLPPDKTMKKDALAKMPPEVKEEFTTPLHAKLPPAMVEHWQFVVLGVYLLDVLVLLVIGKVPLAYNLRNLRVRWLTNGLTAVAFVVVVGFLAFLLAFVNGMNKMSQNSGIPGNVFVLSDGATDEIFSNLGYGEIDNVERAVADLEQVKDAAGKPLLTDDEKEVWRRIAPVAIRRQEIDGEMKYLANKETFYSVNQPVPNSTRRRFVQLRTHENAGVAAAVHGVELHPGGKWFGTSGVDEQSRIQCVLGEGMATTLGGDAGKSRLGVGDTFELGEMTWVVTGVMKSEGKTFGSEIWAKRFSRIYTPFGKDKYTTIVMRTDADTREAARTFAEYLSKKYTQQKLKAFSEPDYYAELTKTNDTLLIGTIVVCVVMAIGGVFGMMTTMFASIASRIRDIGVLRLLGFKRWQVMVSFLLESLAVAIIGGGLGVVLAWLTVNGRTATSTLSSGGGGPGGKSIVLTIDVDWQVMALGLLFALAMGRLGGLVPALSAMRMKILDSLR